MGHIDTDPKNMWRPSTITHGGTRQSGPSKRPASTPAASERSEELQDAVHRVEKPALHAVLNKDQVAMFVPATTVARLAIAAKLVGEGMLGKLVSTLNQGSARAMLT
jgi:hypothetical protein